MVRIWDFPIWVVRTFLTQGWKIPVRCRRCVRNRIVLRRMVVPLNVELVHWLGLLDLLRGWANLREVLLAEEELGLMRQLTLALALLEIPQPLP